MFQLLTKNSDIEEATTIASVWIDRGYIYVQPTPGNVNEVFFKVNTINTGTYYDNERWWAFPVSPPAGFLIKERLGDLAEYHKSFNVLLGQNNIQAADAWKHVPDDRLPEIPNVIRPSWSHQRRGYWYFRTLLGLDGSPTVSAGGGLFSDMGTGKTKVATMLIVNHPELVKRVLVVAPKKVLDNKVWQKEFRKEVPTELIPQFYTLSGSMKDRAAFLKMTADRPGIFITNYDAVVYPAFQTALRSQEWDMIVLDEAHKIKAAGGKMSKFLASLGNHIKYRLAQTGTPSADKPLDVYGLYRFIDTGIFGTKLRDFEKKYIEYGGYMGREIIRYWNLDDMHRRMYQVAFRVSKDVLNLLPATSDNIWVTLDPAAQAAYNTMEDDMIAEASWGDRTSVSNSLAKLTMLQEITSAYMPYKQFDPDTLERLDNRVDTYKNVKQEALEELLESIDPDEPVVVFGRFRFDLNAIKMAAEKMGRVYRELSGTTNNLPEWESENIGSVLGVQIQSGGAGLDFTRAKYCVYYSMNHSLVMYDQSLSRIHRPGQNRNVHYYYIMAKGTVDVDVRHALGKKQDVSVYVRDQIVQGTFKLYRREIEEFLDSPQYQLPEGV